MKTMSTILSLLIICIFTVPLTGQIVITSTNPTAAQVIETIIKKTGSAQIPNTVDVIKEGDPETRVTGIVTTMFATMEVLRKAVEMKCNLIVVHEPLYYNHRDETQQFVKDPVFLEKKKFINDHKLVIWRFHDYIHSARPDGIILGMVEKLGWKNYVNKGDFTRFIIPETNLSALLQRLKAIFPKNAFYVIGKPDMKITQIKLSPGAPGSQSHIASLNSDIDVLIAGEAPQWETYEYARDAVAQGRKKAVIFLGHISSEEAGMDFCAGWFRDFIRDIPIIFVESTPSYWSY